MLDFTQIARQIHDYTRQQSEAQSLFREALLEAGRRLRTSPVGWEETRKKLADAKTSWLLAQWLECPDLVYAPDQRPETHTVISADGSQIIPDRHDIADCYVLNIGSIVLHYGENERPSLSTAAQIYGVDEEMLEDAPDGTTHFSLRRLSIRRLLAECERLAELTNAASAHTPTVALFDGSLILWTLEPEDDDFRSKSLGQFFRCLSVMKENGIPVAGYISNPQSKDVVNSLRVLTCPHNDAHCDRHCKYRMQRQHLQYKKPECSGVERLTDADLFYALLKPGERSAIFESNSKIILNEYRPEFKTRFFYLHTGAEIARIEVPAWVTEDKTLLALTHTLIYDQARKGGGYPVALAEAHELAIIRGAERNAFFQLLERNLQRNHLPINGTQKSLAKKARRV